MKYHFVFNDEQRRLMVTELDDELDCINCTDDDLDCLGEYYRDITVIFDIDRYIRLHSILTELAKTDRYFGKVYMQAVIRSRSGSFEYALMGCCLEIYLYGNTDVEAHWYWKNTNIDFNVALAFPSEFYGNPAAWFEKQIAEKGICPHE